MMNYRLAKEIYGNPWFIDFMSLQKFAGILDHIRNGGDIKQDGYKNNSTHVFNIKEQVTITENVFDAARDDKGNEYISVINIDGAITKNGGASSYGMVELSKRLKRFENLDNVIGHILYTESGGGSATAVKYMTDVINNEIEKPIVSYVEDMSASAAYYINSQTDYIIANDKNAYIGSIGTMIEMAGYPNQAEDKQDGFRYVRIYADDAINKNKEFEEAINNSNFKPIKEKILNPHNDQFKADVSNKRPNIKPIELTGEIFKASEVVGTLIDKIGTFEDVVNKVIELSSDNINNNQKQSKMTKEELKAENSTVYKEILDEGILLERSRVKAFLEFVDVDAEAVKRNIADGNQFSNEFMAEMTKKMASNALKTNIKNDEVKEVEVDETERTSNELEIEAFENELDQELNLGGNK